jgi:hypothetical protein
MEIIDKDFEMRKTKAQELTNIRENLKSTND